MAEGNDSLRSRIDQLEREVALLKQKLPGRGVRKMSQVMILGLPLYHIATGPDPETGENRGHARGIIAIGDIATGIFAFGGVARGIVAVGGLAVGVVAIGGCALGVAIGLGGLAVGLLALGGWSVGVIAIGGGALGYYACGGAAFGTYVINSITQDPIAVEFFDHWLPGVADQFKQLRGAAKAR